MKYSTLVRSNEYGLYVVAGGYKAYPGPVAGYSHVYRMDAGNLKAGDKVHAKHIGQTPLTKIETQDGITLHWHHDYNGKPVNPRGY